MMKKTLSAAIVLLVLICCFATIPLYASAADVISGDLGTGVTWSYDQTTTTLSFTGEGEIPVLTNDEIPWFQYRNEITDVVINEGVTSVSSLGFLSKITTISLPSTTNKIVSAAFQKCTNLQSIDFSKSINSISSTAFDFCYSLQNITIDGNKNGHGNEIVNAVGSVLGEGYFVVDGVLFCNLNQYIAINLSTKKIDHNCLVKYPSGRTEKTYIIPTDTMVIKSEAFSSVINLETIVVPASVTNFYVRSFRGLGDDHEYPLTIIMQHDAYPVDLGSKTFQNLYPGTKVVLKNDALVEEFNNKYSTIVYDFIHDAPGVTFVSASTPTTSLSIDETTLSLKINTTGVIAPTQTPYNTTDSISFESSDSSIASVDSYGCGRITANGVGTAYITVTSGTKTAVCKVTVTCDHEKTSIVGTKEVSCNVNGYTGDKVCDICNTTLVKGSVIVAPGCQLVTGSSKPATCTEDGYTGEVYCSVCGWVEAYSKTVYAFGHSYGSWVVDKTVTCTEKGAHHKVCSTCGDVVSETIAAKGHDYSTAWTIDKEATCAEEGSKSHHCSRCSSKTDVTVIEKKAHSYGAWVTDKASTCTEEGLRHKTCSSCGDVISEVLAKKVHRYSPWVVDKVATCTVSGTQSKSCTNCGDVVTETVGALGHKYSTEWTIDKAATCTANGSKSHHCTRCSSVSDLTVIKATGHDYMWFIDIKATCISEGSKTYRCKYCDDVKEMVSIPVSETHTASSWITDKKATVYKVGSKHKECTDCGEVLETAEIPQLKCSKPKLKSIENTQYGVLTKWSKVSGADKYRVYRKTSKSDWKYIGTTSKTYYTDKTAKSGTKYYYAVRARNEAGNSSLSSALSKYYLADPTLKTPSSTSKGVVLKWNKITGAQGYIIYRKEGSGDYERIATVKNGSKVSYVDTKAQKGKKYTYKVKAYYSKTYSAYSNTKTIKDKY